MSSFDTVIFSTILVYIIPLVSPLITMIHQPGYLAHRSIKYTTAEMFLAYLRITGKCKPTDICYFLSDTGVEEESGVRINY